MKRFERIEEYNITEWEGVTVRVIIQHPKLPHTLTSQMVLDRKMIDDIYYLNLPKDFELMHMDQKIFEYHQWQEKNTRAHNLVKLISNNIAHHICKTLQGELDK